jgi:hypothetical protein
LEIKNVTEIDDLKNRHYQGLRVFEVSPIGRFDSWQRDGRVA